MLGSTIVESHFKRLLNDEYEAYLSKGPRLSLRSFAKKLGLAPSTLHQYLNGKYFPSKKNLMKISESLGWSEKEVQSFLNNQPSEKMDLQVIHLSGKTSFPINDLFMKICSLLNCHSHPEWWEVEEVTRALCHSGKSEAVVEILKQMEKKGWLERRANQIRRKKNLKFVIQEKPEGSFLEFQKQTLKRFEFSLTEIPKKERLVLMAQLRLNESDMEDIAKEMNRFVAKIKAKYERKEPGKFYQIVLGVIPY